MKAKAKARKRNDSTTEATTSHSYTIYHLLFVSYSPPLHFSRSTHEVRLSPRRRGASHRTHMYEDIADLASSCLLVHIHHIPSRDHSLLPPTSLLISSLVLLSSLIAPPTTHHASHSYITRSPARSLPIQPILPPPLPRPSHRIYTIAPSTSLPLLFATSFHEQNYSHRPSWFKDR